jgi:hypothetical protein
MRRNPIAPEDAQLTANLHPVAWHLRICRREPIASAYTAGAKIPPQGDLNAPGFPASLLHRPLIVSTFRLQILASRA